MAFGGWLRDVFQSAWDHIKDAVVSGWHSILDEVIEPVFNALGIEDEEVLQAQKLSFLLQAKTDAEIAADLAAGIDPIDLVQQAKTRAVISMMKTGGSFSDWYIAGISKTQSNLLAFYNYAKFGGYVHGLPTVDITGGTAVDEAIVLLSLILEKGAGSTLISFRTKTPTREEYFEDKFQAAPYYFIPWSRRLTFTDPWGVVRTDYILGTLETNAENGRPEYNLYRSAPEAIFWLEGQQEVVRGNNATYTLKCNRTVPVGTSVSINLSYTGSTLSRRYVSIPVVVLSGGTSETEFVVRTYAQDEVLGDTAITITMDSIVNTRESFEAVTLHTTNSVTTILTDDTSVVITQSPSENPTPVDIDVTGTILESAYTPEYSLVVKYHNSANPAGEWFYWIYKYSDETYDFISPATTLTDEEMLPVVIVKNENGAVNDDKTSDEYLSGKRMLKILGLDIDELTDSLIENENYDQIQDVYVNFALSPSSTKELVSKALWLIFYDLIVTKNLTTTVDTYSMTFVEQSVKNALVWTNHSYTTGLTGTLTDSQEYEHEVIELELITIENPDPDAYERLVTQEASDDFYIRKQTAPNVYAELFIQNLSGLYTIKKEEFTSVITTRVVNEESDNGFTIPVSYSLIRELSLTEVMQLQEYMLRVDVYAADIVNIRWYATSTFSILFKIVSIVITVLSMGSLSFFDLLGKLIFYAAVSELVVYIAIETGNEELAAIVGLVAIIGFGGGPGEVIDFGSAEGLLMASTNFADNLTEAFGVTMEGLAEELEFINETTEERLAEHKAALGDVSPIDAEFLVALKSVDTTMYPAIKAQYDFDLIFNYDKIIKDFYELNYRTGVS